MNVIQTPGVGRRRVLDLHVVVDDPRLAADLGHDPAGLHRDHGEHARARRRARRNDRLVGIRRRNSQLAPYQSDSRNSSVPRPTMTSQARWTTLTSEIVGRSPAGTLSRPCTTVAVPVLGSDSHEARPGIGIPPATVPSEFEVAEQRLGDVARRSAAPARSRRTSSGWSLYTHRASASPTPIWIGVAIAATVKAMTNPSRW